MISPVLKSLFAFFLFFLSSLSQSLCFDVNYTDYQKFKSENESKKLKLVRSHLMRINKPAVKTFQSPDGDIIDCVSLQEQPAFDHPLLRGQRPLDPPKRPKEYGEPIPWGDVSEEDDTLLIFQQLWSIDNNEFCPEGTIPVRRTTEEEVLRATSIRRFGRKIRRVRRDSSSDGHEHAIGYVTGEDYYGAKASINVWAPRVQYEYEFSLSQIWVIAGTFGYDLNTIEAGWQVNPELYGDNHPRFFIYWTSDAYQTTGCYNLLCSGFVQTNNKIAMGAAITPISSYDGGQFDISLLIWKDPKHGNWWLEFGNGILVGYWPSFLFTHLADRANMVQFGGEVVNMKSFGAHTSTQMGSGHFAAEGFGKSAYFRNLQIVDCANKLVPTPNLRVLADHPNCYNVLRGINGIWGNYLYFGGPGRNSMCP